MRLSLICVLLGSMSSAPLLTAQDSKAALANLSDMNRRGQLPQVIEAANSLLATANLAPADQGMVLVYLGHAWQQRGEFTKATADYEKALAVINRDGRHPSDYAATLGAVATVYAQIGQFDTANHVLLRSIHLFESENNHEEAAMSWSDLATIAVEQRSRRHAHKYMTRSIAESKLASNMTPGEFAALATTEGRIAELDGDFRAALADYNRALDFWKKTNKDQQQRIAWLCVLLGGAYLQDGDITNARDMTSRGLTLLEATSGRQTVRYHAAQLVYSKALDASGAHDEASSLRNEAQAGLNPDTVRQRAQSQISVSALH